MTRFEIQDIVSQNQDGVTFRALDKSTDQIVSLRRFFPFGQCDEDEEGGQGLDPQEGKAFSSACARLSHIEHPALRRTIFGDTDPVDGMPFLVTEWLEGESLADVLGNNTMEPSMIIGLVRQALDVCLILSKTLKTEAVWIDTKLEAIIVSNPVENPAFTFRICPFKWLGTQSHQKDLTGIVSMVEALMGWKTKLVSDQAGLGLGGWLKLLRQNPQMAIQDALKTLPDPTTAISSGQATVATASPLGQPVQQPYILASANQPLLSKKSIIIMAISACVTGALIIFLYQQKSKNKDSAPATVEDQKIIPQPPPEVPKPVQPTEPAPPSPDITNTKPEPIPETTPPKTETVLPKTASLSPIKTPSVAWYDATTAMMNNGTVSMANSGSSGGFISGPATLSTNGIGNLQAVQFSGTNQHLTGDFNFTGETLTVFFVGKSLNANQAPFAGIMSVWENGQMYDWDNASSAVLFSQKDALANSIYAHRNKVALSSATGTLTNGFLATTVFNGSTNTLYLNGIPSPGIPSLQSFNTHKVIIGGRWQFSAIAEPYWNGNFGEAMIFNTELSASDRQKIEGYLAHKWGLTAELAADHPYKSSAPNSSSTTETPVSLPKNETPKEEIKTIPSKFRSWAPDEISTTAWYDATDASTITATSGKVSQWRDKSSNGLHLAQSLSARQPSTAAKINSLNALDFTLNAMTTAKNPFGSSVRDAFVIAVYKVDSIQDGTLFSLTGSESHTSRWNAQAPFGDKFMYFDCGGVIPGSTRVSTNDYGVIPGNAVLASFYSSTTDNLQQVHKNGSLLVGDKSGHAVSTVGNISVGGVTTSYQDATIGEMIIINGSVDEATRQKLEGYLAHKWGTTTSLPADHPYKSSAPIPSVLTSKDTGNIKSLKVGDPVTLQGIVKSAKFSSTGKSIYLSFSDPDVETDIRVVIHGSEYDGTAFTEEEFSKLIGQNLVFSGTVYTESFNERPPFVKITEKRQIRKATIDEIKRLTSSAAPAVPDAPVAPNTPAKNDDALSPDDTGAIAKMPPSKPVSVRGLVKSALIPKNSKNLYVLFSDTFDKKLIQVVIDPKKFEGGPYNDDTFKKIVTEFQQLAGKTVTFNGYVQRYTGKNDWHMVSISKRDQFVVEESPDNSAGEVKNQNDNPDKSNPINNIKPGARVKIQGILKVARQNKDQTAILLMFTEQHQEDQLRGVVYKVNYKDEFDIKNFEAFVGKPVSLDGVLIIDGNKEKFIEIINLNQISLLQQ